MTGSKFLSWSKTEADNEASKKGEDSLLDDLMTEVKSALVSHGWQPLQLGVELTGPLLPQYVQLRGLLFHFHRCDSPNCQWNLIRYQNGHVCYHYSLRKASIIKNCQPDVVSTVTSSCESHEIECQDQSAGSWDCREIENIALSKFMCRYGFLRLRTIPKYPHMPRQECFWPYHLLTYVCLSLNGFYQYELWCDLRCDGQTPPTTFVLTA